MLEAQGCNYLSKEEVIIRRATEDDIPAVMEVNLKSLPENYWYGFYLHILRNWPETFLVAEINKKIVGYAMSRIENTSDPVLLGLANELEGTSRSLLNSLVGSIKSILTRSYYGKVAHLVSIAVLKEYRRRGIGSRLLDETIKASIKYYDVESIYLEVRVSNIPAIRLYEKFGFKKVRLIKGYYMDGEDAYVMVRRLKEISS
jgi:ribosomal-protein-alanine N-acetyltransferase